MLGPRLRTAVDRMLPIRGHMAHGLRQELTLRVFAPSEDVDHCWGCIDVADQTYEFTSRGEAVAMLDAYLQAAFDRAKSGREVPDA